MTPEQAAALREPFPESAIGYLPKGGTMLAYVGHAAASDRLLKVDPDWTWEPFALDDRGLPALDPEGNLWIRLTVCGVTRPGVGDGKTAKERIGDAIRNAAMRFGVALDLWAKEDLSSNGDEPHEAPSILERQKERIRARQESAASKVPAEEAPAPDAAEEFPVVGNTVAASTRDKPATDAQKKKLNVLVGHLRDEEDAISTWQLWAALAKERGVNVDEMCELLGGEDDEGTWHWSPLRESLTRLEAGNLIERLEAMEQKVLA